MSMSMKGKQRATLIGLAVIIILFELFVVQTTMLQSITVSELSCISVFDGSNGVGFDITEKEDLQAVLDNLQSTPLKKSGISLGRKGYRFRVTAYDQNGKVLQSFIINSKDMVRKDPFFYTTVPGEGETEAGELCYDLMEELEAKYK